MSIKKEKNKKEQQLPKWVIKRQYRRGPFIFFLLGVLPLCVGLISGILYLKAPKSKKLKIKEGKIYLNKTSFRDNSSRLNLDFDTLHLKAELFKKEENKYLELAIFSESFGQNELEFPNGKNSSIEEYQNKLIRYKKLITVEKRIKIEEINVEYLPNNVIQSLVINQKVIIEKRNELLSVLLWIILPLLLGSYVTYLTFKFYRKYQNNPVV